MIPDRHQQQRNAGPFGDLRRQAARPEGIHVALAMRSQHDQISPALLRRPDQHGGWIAAQHFGGHRQTRVSVLVDQSL